MKSVTISQEELDRLMGLAAETGANAAMKRFEELREQDAVELYDNRLRNTKTLLRNYRLFRAHVSSAVYEAKIEAAENPLAILRDLMTPGRTENMVVESIKRSTTRTAIIVQHIDRMLDCFEAVCLKEGGADAQRRLRVIQGLYISEDKKTVAELAEAENVVERTIYKDVDAACEILAPLMFGIDAVKTPGKRGRRASEN